ncbi:hypothetical protein Bca52824_080048 [Brassica carinata]|uniref:Uncharacterized protein n=1 Tax=Brassica carinata TaxID=52824 RepID=A0A8X7Q463_BRACI|nr:hypothetical protein Bca52824_080048 [Brassica carinata]
MAGGAVVRFGVKLLKMAYPFLKKVSGVILRKGKDWVVKVFGQCGRWVVPSPARPIK